MTGDGFDAIVVGGGMAGLCCAGELVRRGARPLLICESAEVGYTYRPAVLGGKGVPIQQPTRQLAAGGGWWWGLARGLNLPLRMYPALGGARVTLRGTGAVSTFPTCVSAAALTNAIIAMSPIPIEENRAGVERILIEALSIPYQDLMGMGNVRLADWLEAQKADDLTAMFLLTLGGNLIAMPVDDAREHLSVFGCFANLRSYLCGEADLWSFDPDPREGLCVPLAREISQRGGEVWRGRRVQQVLIEHDRAVGVALEDGTEIHAPHVALATGNGRIAGLVDPLPPEVAASLDYDAQFAGLGEYMVLALLDRPVDPDPYRYLLVANLDGSAALANWSINAIAPWAADPGQQVMASEVIRNRAAVDADGGPEKLFADMRDLSDEIHPGYSDATIETVTMQHHHWVTPYTAGPKLPRTTHAIPGLWFVGEGSTPVAGVNMEATASAGILGARDILSGTQ